MQYNSALIAALGDIVYERCLDSGEVAWQGAFTQVLGYSIEEMGSDNQAWLERLYLEEQTQVLTAMEDAFAHGKSYNLEYRFQHQDGSYIWIQDRGVPKENTGAGDTKIVGVMRDISDRKQAELDMHKALMREKELNQLKTRFLDIASHEFRTPLTSILGFSELLEQYPHKFDVDVQRKHIQRIKDAAQRLQALVDDVLSVSRVDAGYLTLELSPTNLEELYLDILEDLRFGLGETHLIRFKLDDKLQGDRRQLPLIDPKIIRYILTNLLSNALKYSLPGKAINLEITCNKNQLTLLIIDQGIGIPQDDISQLFEPFHRAQNVGKIPGTGLGLHIVKRYVDLHNGTIMVTSMMDLGTTFRLNFPCLFIHSH